MDDVPNDGLQRPGLHGAPCTADDVDAFLRADPGFLAARPALYDALHPPQDRYGAPIADHMAAMVQSARRRVEQAEHAAAAEAAGRRANEGFARRVQNAVLALLRTPDPAWTATNDLPTLLGLDAARLCSEASPTPPGVAPIPHGTVAALLGHRAALLRPGTPDTALHGEAVALAEREALIRVPLTAPTLLVLTCRDPAAMAGATTETLTFLGNAIAAALDRTTA